MKLLLGLSLLLSSTSFGQTLNVLSWWGYVNNSTLQNLVQETCDVNLSIDSYYTDNEFIERILLNQESYDIAIFSNILTKLVSAKLALTQSPLQNTVNHYLPAIQDHLAKVKNPKNFYIYGLTISGILINKNITTYQHVANNFFELANNYKLIILDDPIEGLQFINHHNNINYKNLYITNGYNKIYQSANFAAAFIWAGDALENIKQHHELKFYLDDQYSHLTYDIITHLNNDEKTICATKVLLSHKAQEIMQDNDLYLSPLGIEPKDKTQRQIYYKFINNM